MKSKFVSLFLYISFFTLVFSSCKTDVNIFSEGEETTIVYGYLDVDADTNYVKITKSFVGNALENAPIYSSSNYDYKLMVTLTGKFADMPNVVSNAILDTTSVFKPYDPDGIFYSGRDQVLYYTTRKLLENENYQLVIERNDGEIIKSNVRTISGSTLRKPQYQISFESDFTNQIRWKPENYELAAYYEVVGYFHYRQLNNIGEDTSSYTMKWVMGSGTGEQLWSSGDMLLSVNYTPSNFYKNLASDYNITSNSPDFVQRFADNFEIVITSTGEELYNYILIQNSGSAIQDTPEYTNIENGMGIFSSRAVSDNFINISELSLNTLVNDYPQWGFKRIYNK